MSLERESERESESEGALRTPMTLQARFRRVRAEETG